MTPEPDKSIKDVEDELTEVEERAKALEQRLAEAEVNHPSQIDHADDGGVF